MLSVTSSPAKVFCTTPPLLENFMSAKDDLPPDTTTHFIGAISPRELHTLVNEKVIKPAEAWLLLEIGSLVHPKHGCYIGNDKLAERVGLSVRRMQEVISRLTDLGLIRVLWYDGHRRHIETRWVRVEGKTKKSPRRSGTPGGGADVRETARPTCEKPHVAYKRSIKANMSAPKPEADGGGVEGFGLAKTKPKKTTKFDVDIATQLKEAAAAHLGSSHPRIVRGRPSAWAHQILLLRTLDEIPPDRIQKVLDWFARRMGAEFVPVAYNAEAFRKKFLAIEEAMARDVVGTTTVSPEAGRIAERLAMLGWPKGSAEMVSQAVQVCLEGYRGWVTRFKATTARLEAQKGQARLIRLAQHVDRVLPAPSQFVQGWMTEVNNRVSGWDEWSGDLKPFLYKPESKKFRSMGRGWAEAYNNDPDSWDRLIDMMKTEGTA